MFKNITNYFATDYQTYFEYLMDHIYLSVMSLLIATLIGVGLGILSYKHSMISEWLISTSQFLRIIPSLAILFILIPIIGVGQVPAVIALVFLGIPSVLVNTILGFREVPKITKEVEVGMGMNSKELLRKIEFPLALPHILNGIKLALVEIIASATLATYIGAGGLGTLIFTGLGLYRMDLLLIGGVSVSLLSLLSMLLGDLIITKVAKNHG